MQLPLNVYFSNREWRYGTVEHYSVWGIVFIPEHYYYYDNTHTERITLNSLPSTAGPAKIQLIGIPTV